jgi:hypothetical protein
MLNELVPKNVKAATVALGLVKKGSAEPFVICVNGVCKAKKVEVERAILW